MKELLISTKTWLEGTRQDLRNLTRLRKKDLIVNKFDEDKNQALESVIEEETCTELREDMSL